MERWLQIFGAVVTFLGGYVTWDPTGRFPTYVGMLTMAVGLAMFVIPTWKDREIVHEWFHRLRPRELTPLLEVRNLAMEQGWDFGSLQALDFIRALDEAGRRGLLEFYARDSEGVGSLA